MGIKEELRQVTDTPQSSVTWKKPIILEVKLLTPRNFDGQAEGYRYVRYFPVGQGASLPYHTPDGKEQIDTFIGTIDLKDGKEPRKFCMTGIRYGNEFMIRDEKGLIQHTWEMIKADAKRLVLGNRTGGDLTVTSRYDIESYMHEAGLTTFSVSRIAGNDEPIDVHFSDYRHFQEDGGILYEMRQIGIDPSRR